jgi:hypothetical protein
MIKLQPFTNQQLNESKNLGFMRFDFADGNLANLFIPGKDFSECSDIEQLQEELNDILFNNFETWEAVGDLIDPSKCLAEFSFDDTLDLFAETDKFQYFIRLLPCDVSKIQAYQK